MTAGTLGAGAALLADLDEEIMLGDAGANALGALLGVALAARTGPAGRALALTVLAGLTAASEKVSFTKVIQDTPWLRELDALGAGRLRDPSTPGPGRGSRARPPLDRRPDGRLPAWRVRPVRCLPATPSATRRSLANVYNAANTIPNIIFELVAGGAVASLVVPLMAGAVDAGDRRAGHRDRLRPAQLGLTPDRAARGARRAGGRSDRRAVFRPLRRTSGCRRPGCCGSSRRSFPCTGWASC